MLRTLLVLELFLLSSVSMADNGFSSRCNCDHEGSFWHVHTILEMQKVADFLIAIAYFSIPVELVYFLNRSYVPYKFVIFEFVAFIVLCGLTHLFNGLTSGPHRSQLMTALTVFKMLTGLVSCVTAISLFTLIPNFFSAKIREFLLAKKACELDREVGIILKQKETGVHVRMLTREIRKSLDRHTILYTTLVELSKTLGLHSCAVWMPNEVKTEMNLTHQLKSSNDAYSDGYRHCSIPINDCDVARIKRCEEVNLLSPDSALAKVTSRGEPGPTVGIRVPMLRVSNFKGGTPEVIQMCYAILVCILPPEQFQRWTHLELEIVKVVADQVAVAISHATILEESQLMREKLVEQNRALQVARQRALRASQARTAFEQMMSDAMRRPVYSILGLLSMMRGEKLPGDQKIIIDTMAKTSNLLSVLINNATNVNSERAFSMEMRGFSLHSFVKEAACSAKCLCVQKGFGFSTDVDKSLVDHVVGDNRRVFQVMLHMLGHLLNRKKPVGRGGNVIFGVFPESGSTEQRKDSREAVWRQSYSNEYVNIRFEFGIAAESSVSEEWHENSSQEEHLSFSICQKLVKLMNGSIWAVPSHQGSVGRISVVLRFQIPTLKTRITPSSSTFDILPKTGSNVDHQCRG